MSIRYPGDLIVRDVEITCKLPIVIGLIFITELKEFLSVLDKRADDIRSKIKHHAADRKPRLLSEPAAESIPPQNSPKWTISKEWKKGRISVIMLN